MLEKALLPALVFPCSGAKIMVVSIEPTILCDAASPETAPWLYAV